MALPVVPAPDGCSRLDELTSWHADWSGLRVVVLGLGITGFAVADTLTELGVEVVVVAEGATEDRIRMLEVIGGEWVSHDGGSRPPQRMIEFDPDLIVVSPGFHLDHGVLLWAADRGTPVWGDIELAWRLRDKIGKPADWITVTGTNGKTTTVQLTSAMLAAGGHRAAPCGNIGVPVLDAIRDPQGFDVLVVELSSYQLHWVNPASRGAPSPHSSVCLNVSDDHIDWHGSFEAYRQAKATVYQNTTAACVYNLADPATEAMVRDADVAEGARAIGFGPGIPARGDLGIVDGILCDRAFGDQRSTSAIELATVDELRDRGLAAPHTLANILAASALARSYQVVPQAIHTALLGFGLDAHRGQLVRDSCGIRWVDDSKATNLHAAAASLNAYEPVVWVVGGLLKGVDIDPLVRENAGRLRAAILIGVDRGDIRAAFARHAPALPVYEVETTETGLIMPEAVRLAADVAREGDTVLLAPAAASMDQFSDYAARGDAFQAAVREFFSGHRG